MSKPSAKKHGRIFRAAVFSAAFLICAALAAVSLSGYTTPLQQSLYHSLGFGEFSYEAMQKPVSVHFIDVGNGDCAWFHTAETDILIDTGEHSLSCTAAQYLRHAGAEKLDLFIASHTDSDHIGDFEALADSIPVGEIWMSSLTPSGDDITQAHAELLNAAGSHGIKLTYISEGKYRLRDIELDILSPVCDLGNVNDNSLVIRMSCGGFSCLFTGDAGEAAEKLMLSRQADLRSDVLKVGHHGSKTGSTKEFLDAVKPEYAVVSVGEQNRALPDRNTIGRLEETGCTLLRTDINGNIAISYSDDEGIQAFCEHNGS